MGRRLDNSDRGVMITAESVRRIAKVIQKIENGGRAIPPQRIRTAEDEGDPVRIGKTTSAWTKNTLATITLYEEGEPPNETADSPAKTLEDCVNKFGDVESGKWVSVARAANGSWYLIAAEC